MINLEDHKVYVDALKMEMVPYTTAVQAIEQLKRAFEASAIGKIEDTISETLATLEGAFDKINNTIASTPIPDEDGNLSQSND